MFCSKNGNLFGHFLVQFVGLIYDSVFSCSQISDFGLAKLMPEGQEMYVTTRVQGTFGYFDPEYTSVWCLATYVSLFTFSCSSTAYGL